MNSTPLLLAALLTTLPAAQAQDTAKAPAPAPTKATTLIDPDTGLAVAPGFPIVKAYCTACHSAKLITQAGKSREGWLESIRWMQRTQGLFNLGDTEPEILGYLAAHYGIKAQVGGMLKLPPLAAGQMPPLPAKAAAR